MKCEYFAQQRCLSCSWLAKPYSEQLREKQTILASKLAQFTPFHLYAPVASRPAGFRNKAKMAVLGQVEQPILGIITAGQSVDLCDCPLYSPKMQTLLHGIKSYIKELQLVPYNIPKDNGEIKFVILTEAEGWYMLRLVLRSTKSLEKIKQSIGSVQQQFPSILVISVNIQPRHAAVLEGEDEYILTSQQQLPITFNHKISLFIRPKSFFQTNTLVAEKLYLTAKNWLVDIDVRSIWDLFCGVGGFGLHCIEKNTQLLGIEINPDAIACAKLSAQQLGFDNLSFQSLDASEFALTQGLVVPDVILVNPPRRGIGQTLVDYLQSVSPTYIIYSSCNLESLTNDLGQLSHYQLMSVQLFDMFPHTEHMEILTLLKRKESNEMNCTPKVGQFKLSGKIIMSSVLYRAHFI